MSFQAAMKEEIMKGDFKSEDEDLYVKMLEADTRRNLALKIGIGTLYVLLLIVSLFLV